MTNRAVRACEAISLLTVCQPRKPEIASFLAMTGVFVIASLRSNLSFLVRPAMKNRDRRAVLAMTGVFVIASLRSNLSFLVRPAMKNRDRHVPRDDR